MVVMHALLLLLLGVLSVWVLTVLLKVLRGAQKRRLCTEALEGLCDVPQGVGISVLCSCAGKAPEISNLLDVGYGRYEVVLVADAAFSAEDFAALVARYDLIRVGFTSSVSGVRGLYRSRKRCFRRLVVLDKKFTTVSRDLDAAIEVAAFDYLLPVPVGGVLMPHAIVRLAAELGGAFSARIDLVCSQMGTPAMVIDRERVVAAGGFEMQPWRSVPPRRRTTLYEPLLRPDAVARRMPMWVHVGWCVLLAGGIVAVALAGWWLVCAVLLTMALMWTVDSVIATEARCTISLCGAIRFLLHNINVKNFTAS